MEHIEVLQQFLKATPIAEEITGRVYKWEYINWKNFCIRKLCVGSHRVKRGLRMGENLCQVIISWWLISRIYEIWKTTYIKWTSNPIKKTGDMTWADTSPKKYYKCTINSWRKAQHLYPSGKCHSKLGWFPLTPVRMALIQKVKNFLDKGIWTLWV